MNTAGFKHTFTVQLNQHPIFITVVRLNERANRCNPARLKVCQSSFKKEGETEQHHQFLLFFKSGTILAQSNVKFKVFQSISRYTEAFL